MRAHVQHKRLFAFFWRTHDWRGLAMLAACEFRRAAR